MSLSIIVPTKGRWTLERTLDSIRPQLAPDDELIVVHKEEVVLDPSLGRGGAEKVEGAARATRTHLAFMDDDDIYLPGALEAMRTHATDVPVVFRMDGSRVGIGTIWREPVLRYTNVSTQMFVVPNDPAKLGVWVPHEQYGVGGKPAGQDFTFLKGCCERMGAPVWREEVISQLRPHPTISVVTPWWNHPELAADYMAAVVGDADEIVVVDNGSDPPLDLPGIRLDDNTGFSHASNVGLDAARGEAVLFLNNDVVMTRSDWLRQIRDAIEPGVLIGAQLRTDPHADVDGERMPYLDGWCVAGMKDDLLELGGWDESLDEPSYYGDNLLSLRAREAGMRLREVQVGLRHKLNVSANDHPDVAAASAANRQRYVAAVRELLVAV